MVAQGEMELLLDITGSRSEAAKLADLMDDPRFSVATTSVQEIVKICGIGRTKARRVVAAMKLGQSMVYRKTLQDARHVDTSKKAYDVLRPMMENLAWEEVWALYMNRANKLIQARHVNTGSATMSVMNIRRILREAIMLNAGAIIVAHNHPSGTLAPSSGDIESTKQLRESARAMEIRVQDHLIVTSGGYYSFADNGHI